MDNIDNMNDYGTTQYERSGTTSTAHDKSSGVRTYRPNRPSTGGGHKSFQESSPEEIQQLVSEKVAKAVAAAAGAVEGFATQMKQSRVAENARDAITSVGKTASTIVGTTRKQFSETRNALQGDIESLDTGSEEESEGSGSGGFGKSGGSGGESYGGPSYQDDTASSSGSEMNSGSGGKRTGGGSGKGMGGKSGGSFGNTAGKKSQGGNVGF